ncbi:ankyrin repeat domain-containing protein [Pseudomonadota bacterium]
MNKFIVTVLLIIAVPNVSLGEPSASVQNKESAWFLPSLQVNKHKICNELLSRVQDTFLSEESYSSIYYDNTQYKYIPVVGMTPVEYGSDTNVIMEEIDHGDEWGALAYQGTPTVMIDGKKIYLHPYKHPGCGGACETYQLIASDQRQPANWGELTVTAIPSTSDYRIYKAADGSFWSHSYDTSEGIAAYQLKKDGQWEKSCEIQTKPADAAISKDDDVQKVMDSLTDFKTSVFGITRGSGSCGSSNIDWRLRNAFESNLPIILYRPWAMRQVVYHYDIDDKVTVGLNDWSLMGLSEYQSHKEYLTRFDKTVLDIAEFYQRKLSLNKSSSIQLASDALATLANSAFSFSSYYEPIKTKEERDFRKAILEDLPFEEIKSIQYEIKNTGHDGGESLLSLAVLYPEALQYLLSKGLNPNHQNDFGKTPLIYAAQYNQPESVKMLLEAGADPNVKTTRPVNDCFYTIRTYNMTPLHYAVRYASPEIIKMLLDHGAATFIKVDNQREYPPSQETVSDWLIRYTRSGFEEKNPNIPDSRLDEVKSWIKPTDLEAPSEVANEYVLKAEELYQQRNVLKSYQLLGLALELQPDNERALSDMSLMALKNGKLGQSIEAGERLIKQSKSDKLKANAWFNQGLACEEHESKRPDDYFGYRYPLNYNGHRYCVNDAILPFYKAVKTYFSEARKEKLIKVFDQPSDAFCDIPEKGVKLRREFPKGPEGEALYVLHDTELTISDEMLGQSEQFAPKKMHAINLGDKTLSVFSSERGISFPYDILGYRCTQGGETKAEKLK